MKELTRLQLTKALEENKYILATTSDGDLVGLTNGLLKTKRHKEYMQEPNKTTMAISYKSCTFQEYITHKGVFIG